MKGYLKHWKLYLFILIIMGIFVTVILIGKRLDPRQRAAVINAPKGCQSMQINQGINYNGVLSDRFIWYDSNCQQRSAAMGRNNTTNAKGGVMHQYTYDIGTSTRTVNGSGGTWQGFGYLASHYGSTADHSSGKIGTFSTPLPGSNHAIHQYKWRLNLPNPVDVTVNWFFATGRDYPIYAITYDSRPSGANANSADSRSPYGDMQWTGDPNDPVEFVGWGDRYKFRTTSTPLNFSSNWDYSTPNTIPYAYEQSESKNAEMGIVQTQTYLQHDGGGYWAYDFWGKNSNSPNLNTGLLEPGGKMPASWNWTYQLNQYEIPFQNPVTSKRLAWGLNYGSVGLANYNVYGDDRQASGYPFQSYSTYVVLGVLDSVAKQVTEVENVQKTTLTASIGSVVSQGPGGVGRTDNVTYQPAGYNQIYGTWELNADAQGQASFTLNTTSGNLKNPIFVIKNYPGLAAPNTIIVNGETKTRDIDFFTTMDGANSALWITLLGTHSGSTQIQMNSTSSTVTPPTTTPTTPASTPTFTPSPTRTPTPTPTRIPTPSPSNTPTPTTGTGKTGDLNGDNQVGIVDLSILLSNWNTTNAIADVNRDGTVGILDLSIMLSNWGL